MLFALLVPETHRSLWIAVAIVAAVVSTLSWIQGFVAWPIGVVCLVWCRPTGGRSSANLERGWAQHWHDRPLPDRLQLQPVQLLPVFRLHTDQSVDSPHRRTSLLPGAHWKCDSCGFLEGTPQLLVYSCSSDSSYCSHPVGSSCSRGDFVRPPNVSPSDAAHRIALLVDLTIMWGRLGGGLLYAVGGNRYVLPNIVLLAGIVMYAWTHRPWSEVVRGETSLKMVLGWVGFVGAAFLLVTQVFVAQKRPVRRASVGRTCRCECRTGGQSRYLPTYERTCVATASFGAIGDSGMLARDDLAEFGPGAYSFYRSKGLPRLLPVCRKSGASTP